MNSMMREESRTRVTAKSDDRTSFITTYMVSPIISVMYLGRGRQASTKPDVITRNDLLRAAQEVSVTRPSETSSVSSIGSDSSVDSRERDRRSRRSHRRKSAESEHV